MNDRYACTAPTFNQESTKRTDSKPIGFTTEYLEKDNIHPSETATLTAQKHVGFIWDATNERKEKDPFEELQQIYLQKQIQIQQSKGLPFVIHDGRILVPQNEVIDKFMQDFCNKNKLNRDSDSDNDEEFLDTTTNIPSPRKNSLTSNGSKKEGGCIIS